jgi:hypothetical protein
MYPEVKVTFDGHIFACSYVKNGSVCSKISEDGGATWTHEAQVQDSQAVNEYGSHDLGRGKKGIYAIWEDNRGPDIDIYFGQELEIPYPDLDIKSIEGPIGVTVTIKNIGGAEVTNVEWTLKVKGGIRNKINKEGTGIEPTLVAGAEIKAKSGIIIGLGKITIDVYVTCDENIPIYGNANGMQIFFFTLI